MKLNRCQRAQPLYVHVQWNVHQNKNKKIYHFSLFDPIIQYKFRRMKKKHWCDLRMISYQWCDIKDIFFCVQATICMRLLLFFRSLSHHVCLWLSSLFIYTSIFTFIFRESTAHCAHYYLFNITNMNKIEWNWLQKEYCKYALDSV